MIKWKQWIIVALFSLVKILGCLRYFEITVTVGSLTLPEAGSRVSK